MFDNFDDLKDELEPLLDDKSIELGNVSESDLLNFAKFILGIIALMYVCASISEFMFEGNSVYETCKISLPPLATLVIGYYFGSHK